jgi:hypothetical protein
MAILPPPPARPTYDEFPPLALICPVPESIDSDPIAGAVAELLRWNSKIKDLIIPLEISSRHGDCHALC